VATPCDPNFANVGVLLQLNEANGATTFVDSSTNALTVTNVNSVTGSNTQPPPFQGTAASILPRATIRTLTVPIVASGPVDLSSGDFTVEGWVWGASQDGSGGGGAGVMLSDGVGTASPGPNQLLFNPSGKQVFGQGIFAGQSPVQASPILSQWISFAFVRISGTLKVYFNGVAGSGVSTSGTTSGNWQLGAALNSEPFSGYLAGFRITKGVGRYTQNYTPSAPGLTCFPQVPNVVGLTRAAAIALLTADGFNYTITEVNQTHPTVPAGSVVSQSPAAGTSAIHVGDNVTINISVGVAPVAGTGGDTWGANGGDLNPPASPPILGQVLAYGQQPENAITQGSQSVMSSLSTGKSITQNTPASNVPTTPKVGSSSSGP
jgi:hypothetical protein